MPLTITEEQSNLIDGLRKQGPLLQAHGIGVLHMPRTSQLDELVQTKVGEAILAQILTAAWELQSAADRLVAAVGDLTRHAAEIEAAVANGFRVDTGFLEADSRRISEAAGKRQAIVDRIVLLGHLARQMEEGK